MIQGRRVALVPLGAEHADELAGLLEDAFVRDALGVGDERWLSWVVRERVDGRALGWVQATVRGATASIAYALELGVTDLTASIAPANLASAHVAPAVGLQPTDGRDAGELIWVAKRAHVDRPAL